VRGVAERGTVELLKNLCEAGGVPGYEDEVRRLVMEAVGSYTDTLEADALGNLYAGKGADRPGPHITFAAHTDEVGLMVERVTDEGYLKFTTLGGIDPRVLPAKRVRVGGQAIAGVIGVNPFHYSNTDEADTKVIPVCELHIDIGASSRSQAERFAEPGTPVWFDTAFERHGDVLKAKAFDDRAGCYMLAELARHEFDSPVSLVWTVQEELGLRGARLIASRLKPDVLVVLEGTAAGEAPADAVHSPSLGKGPVITILDRSVAADERLVELFVRTADESRIPWQFKRPLVGGTDAGAVVRTRPVRAAVLAIPARYIHSPVALADAKDIINTIELVKRAAERFKEVV